MIDSDNNNNPGKNLENVTIQILTPEVAFNSLSNFDTLVTVAAQSPHLCNQIENVSPTNPLFQVVRSEHMFAHSEIVGILLHPKTRFSRVCLCKYEN